MSKPLTIEQLKSLEVGDWVWVVAGDKKNYYTVIANDKEYLDLESINSSLLLDYSDYGTKWVAYKNKEMAESKGDIVELPCLKDVYMLSRGIIVRCKELIYLSDGGLIQIDLYEETEFSEAERRLAELKGEK